MKDAEPVVDNGDGLDEDCRCHVGATDVQQKLLRQIQIINAVSKSKYSFREVFVNDKIFGLLPGSVSLLTKPLSL